MHSENLYVGGEGGILGVLERHNLDAVALPSAVAFEVLALVGAPIIQFLLEQPATVLPLKKKLLATLWKLP